MVGQPLLAHPAECPGVLAARQPHAGKDHCRDRYDDNAEDEQHVVLDWHPPWASNGLYRMDEARRCSRSHSAGAALRRLPGREDMDAPARVCIQEQRHSAAADTLFEMELESHQSHRSRGWVSAMCAAAIAGYVTSLSGWTVRGGAAVSPPLVMMWRGDTPRAAMSESLQEALR